MHDTRPTQQGKDTLSMIIVGIVSCMLFLVVSGVELFVGMDSLQVSLHKSAPVEHVFTEAEVDFLSQMPADLKLIDQRLMRAPAGHPPLPFRSPYQFFHVLPNTSEDRLGLTFKDPALQMTYAVLLDTISGEYRSFGPLRDVSIVPSFRGKQLHLLITRGDHSYEMLLDL